MAGGYSIHVGGNDLSPVLYYYSGLQGWTLQAGEWNLGRVDSLIDRGATFFASRQMKRELEAAPFLLALRERYPLLYENAGNDTFLLDLRQKTALERRERKETDVHQAPR